MILIELFDKAGSSIVKQDDGRLYRVQMNLNEKDFEFVAEKITQSGSWKCDFGIVKPNGTLSFSLTNDHNAIKILAFVRECMIQLIKKHHPMKIFIVAFGSRASTYEKMLKKYLHGYELSIRAGEALTKFTLTRIQHDPTPTTDKPS